MNTKDIGTIGEYIAIVNLLELGYKVSIPVGDNYRYDLLVDDGIIYRVQVKSTQITKEGKIVFDFRSTYSHRGNNNIKYSSDEIDYIIGIEIQNKKCFLFDKDIFEKQSTKTLKLDNTEYLLATL